MIMTFDGDYRFLSNFYNHIQVHGEKVFPTNEHWFQSQKTLNLEHQERIRLATTPGIAKRMGSKKGYKGFKITIRPDWDIIKFTVMIVGLREKFKNPYLKMKLVETGQLYLIEGNTWHDNFWGHCTCEKCIKKEHLNMLGKILMKLRREFLVEQ